MPAERTHRRLSLTARSTIRQGPQAGGAVSNAGVRRIPTSRRAALYALDALTGRELWNSGNEITSWSHYSGLTIANGRAFITTFDGMIYAFGIKR